MKRIIRNVVERILGQNRVSLFGKPARPQRPTIETTPEERAAINAFMNNPTAREEQRKAINQALEDAAESREKFSVY